MTETALEDLVTGAEAARRLGVSRQRLQQLAARDDFPEPLGVLGRANVWRSSDVAGWAASQGRRYETPHSHRYVTRTGQPSRVMCHSTAAPHREPQGGQ